MINLRNISRQRILMVSVLCFAFLFAASAAFAALTVSSTSVTSDGALTQTGAATSTWSLSAGNLTVAADAGSVNLTATGATAGDMTLTVGDDYTANVTGLMDLNVTEGFTLDATTLSIDGTDTSNLTVTGSAKNLTLAVAGGGAQVLAVNSAGTGANAIDLNATGTGGGVTVDTTSGAIVLTAAGATAGDVTITVGDDFTVNGVATSVYGIGTGDVAQTLNLGTGTDIDTINIGTGATGVDVIRIGQAAADLALTDAQWSITSPGVGTLVNLLVSPSATTGVDVGSAGALSVGRVNATSVVIGSAATTAITLTTDATGDGTDVVLPAQSVNGSEMLNNTVTTTQLAAALTFAALDFVDLALVVQDTTANQGLRLPQAASATPSSPTSGEGYLAWNVAGNQLIAYDGAAWITALGNATAENTWTDNQIYTFGADEDILINAATTDTTVTTGVLNIDVDTITANAIGASLDFQVGDAAGANTYYSLKNDVTVDIDAAQIATVYGDYVGLTVNHATGVTYGMAVEQQAAAEVVTAGILVDNLDADDAMTNGILLRSAAGAMTTALNVLDPEIVTALSVGANAIEATELDFNIAPTGSTSSIAVTASADAEDFLIDLIADFNTTLALRSAGNAADALTLTTTAGGMDISVTGNAAGEDLDISAVGAATEMRLASASTEVDAIRLNASAGGIDIDATNSTLTVSNTANGAADDFTLAQVGAQDSSLLLTSAGTGGDAIGLTATAGGIVLAAGEAAGAGTASTVTIISETVFDNTANVTFTSQIFTSAGAGTLTPTSTFVVADNTGAQAALTLSETGAVDGQLLIIAVDVTSAAAYTIADTDGTANTSAALTLDVGDTVVFIYDAIASEWVQLTTSNN